MTDAESLAISALLRDDRRARSDQRNGELLALPKVLSTSVRSLVDDQTEGQQTAGLRDAATDNQNKHTVMCRVGARPLRFPARSTFQSRVATI